jgi:hypothetical protein
MRIVGNVYIPGERARWEKCRECGDMYPDLWGRLCPGCQPPTHDMSDFLHRSLTLIDARRRRDKQDTALMIIEE